MSDMTTDERVRALFCGADDAEGDQRIREVLSVVAAAASDPIVALLHRMSPSDAPPSVAAPPDFENDHRTLEEIEASCAREEQRAQQLQADLASGLYVRRADVVAAIEAAIVELRRELSVALRAYFTQHSDADATDVMTALEWPSIVEPALARFERSFDRALLDFKGGSE